MTTTPKIVDERLWRRDWWLKRTTAADKTDKVQVSYQYARHAVYTTIVGDEEDVFDHVAHIIQNDTCTLMYEHMLTQVIDITVDDTGKTKVKLYDNQYAGD